jgi:tetrahydromethanopterin S-methyltransferase subunit E
MNRVWKKFLGKFVEPLAFIAYSMFAIVLTMWSGTVVNEFTGIAVFFIMIVIPVFSCLIRDMWRDAKREVEYENRYMLDTLKGE